MAPPVKGWSSPGESVREDAAPSKNERGARGAGRVRARPQLWVRARPSQSWSLGRPESGRTPASRHLFRVEALTVLPGAGVGGPRACRGEGRPRRERTAVPSRRGARQIRLRQPRVGRGGGSRHYPAFRREWVRAGRPYPGHAVAKGQWLQPRLPTPALRRLTRQPRSGRAGSPSPRPTRVEGERAGRTLARRSGAGSRP